MPLVMVVIGVALLLLAWLGPRFGLHNAVQPAAQDQRQATILILRMLAALLGLWLLFISAAHLLHDHGSMSPSAVHDQR